MDQQIIGLVLGIALGAGAVVLGLLHDGYDAIERERGGKGRESESESESKGPHGAAPMIHDEYRLDDAKLDETGPFPTVCDTKEEEERAKRP